MQLGKQGGKLMHADLIEPTREEVLRLITKQDKLLSDLLKIPNIFQESDGAFTQPILYQFINLAKVLN
jgi:hypothetical protein